MKTWKELRGQYVTTENESQVAEAAEKMLAKVRAYRLAEARKSRNITQEQVAQAMHVTQTRVSQIERGTLNRTEVDTLAAYVDALGGHLEVIANFGDQRLILG